jgi:hypothetical protein
MRRGGGAGGGVSFACVAALVAGCSRSSAQADRASASATTAAVPAPAASPSIAIPPARASSSSAAAPSTAPDASSSPLAEGVQHFFAGFVEGTDFSFLRTACAPKMTHFIAMKDVDVESAIRAARASFQNLRHVKYTADVGAMQADAAPAGTRVRVPVDMQYDRPMDPQQFGIDPDEIESMKSMDLLKINHDVTADVELVFDPSGRVTSYVETKVHRPPMRVSGDKECENDLPKGSIVYDLGEDAITWWISIGPARTVHRVLANGEDVWMTSQRAMWGGGPNPEDRSYWECLSRVGDAGR